MAWREAQAPLSVPESDRQEVVLQKVRPHGDSHEFPQFHWLVGWLLIQRCAKVLPLNAIIKGQEGG